MAYHQGIYLFCFLPFVVLVYALTPRKIRRAVLILAGYVFFWSFSRWLVVYLIGVTTLIYGIGRHMDHLKAEGKKKAKEQGAREPRTFIKKQYKYREKRTLISGILLLLGILGYLKWRDRSVRGMRLLMHSGNVHQYAWKILHREPYVLYGECSRRS